jgi:hypothetical protein
MNGCEKSVTPAAAALQALLKNYTLRSIFKATKMKI